MTEEQRKWYLAGANDMEAGRLVRVGPLLVATAPTLTAEEAKALIKATRHISNLRAGVNYYGEVFDRAFDKLSLIANGEKV